MRQRATQGFISIKPAPSPRPNELLPWYVGPDQIAELGIDTLYMLRQLERTTGGEVLQLSQRYSTRTKTIDVLALQRICLQGPFSVIKQRYNKTTK